MIEPGSAFPGDHASRSTPVAKTREDVERLAGNAPTLDHLTGRSSVCRACPRLVAWREQVAEEKKAAFADQVYWGRPVTGFGDGKARVLVVGLAPAAHGGNRTGRAFTGDRSADFLYAALHRAGLANQPTSDDAHDGLELRSTRIVMPVRCAPPQNRPNTAERDTCRGWLTAELRFLLPTVRAVVVLGSFGWTSLLLALRDAGLAVPTPLPDFGHGVELALPDGPVLLGSYHVSQQNTFTGRLTPAMLDAVLERAKDVAGLQ